MIASSRTIVSAIAISVVSAATLHPAMAQLSRFDVKVSSFDDIFAAGLPSDPVGGNVPAAVALPPGTLCAKVTKVAGTLGGNACSSPEKCISLDGKANLNDPSGTGGQNRKTSNTGMGPISGLSAPGEGYLAGVFTLTSVTGTPPPALIFGKRRSSSLSPLLNQSFLIGDGRVKDGVGGRVSFTVPAGAANLYFGISDSCHYGYKSPHSPGCYYDNKGTFRVHVETSLQACPISN